LVMTISVVTSVKTVGSKKLPPNLYVDGGGALAAGHHLGALVDGVGDVRLDFSCRLHVNQRPDHRVGPTLGCTFLLTIFYVLLQKHL
jgi:hypothetical protein